MKNSKQRITIQDDKIVVLQRTADGLYHGYIVEDLSSLDIEVRKSLVANGHMKDATAKKLI